MKNLKFIVLVIACTLLGSGIVSAKLEKTEDLQASEELLRTVSRDEQNRTVQQLSRSFANLERKVDRLEDRLERLDEDFKELKRNLNSRS